MALNLPIENYFIQCIKWDFDRGKTKSANVVGQTMKLNPHGDMAIYETMVRLTRGNDALLHPFIDSRVILENNIPEI